MVISESTVEEIERLLAEGRLSQRQIARNTGISRGSVNAIANGTRRVFAREEECYRYVEAVNKGNHARCSGCGGMQELPCMVCEMRNRKKRMRK